MSRLSTFFKGADTQLGTFYPNNCLLAMFPTLADADRAKKGLTRGGPVDYDAISASGEEVVHFAEEHLLNDGLWGALMTELSRALGTGASYSDQDLASAKNGAGFVAVYCHDEETKAGAWRILEQAHPITARYYSSGGIEQFNCREASSNAVSGQAQAASLTR